MNNLHSVNQWEFASIPSTGTGSDDAHGAHSTQAISFFF